ncbi:MAG: penicillin-insensitive murein endopeptidase [Polyangiaceae bacterium]|nr:penicillin-insensitive murein endopeptidase [Polyangiaceae bacterium]
MTIRSGCVLDRHWARWSLVGALVSVLVCVLGCADGCASAIQSSTSGVSERGSGQGDSGDENGNDGTSDESDELTRGSVGGDGDDESSDEVVDDGGEHDGVFAHQYRPVDHPLASVTDAEIERLLEEDPESLGSMSFGATNGGSLRNGVQMPEGDRWHVMDRARAWGTREMVDGLVRCIDVVNASYPGSPVLQIGHLSLPRGGALSPHVSHQAGRDVDLGFFYTGTSRWYERAHAGNLDRARTWALVRALIVETDVEMILIDVGLQKLLREHALGVGEDAGWVDDVFRGVVGQRPPLIRHAPGHATHMHVRFFSPIARETARRVQAVLVKQGKAEVPMVIVMHRARSGDTLGRLANMYGTTVEAIQKANGLRSSKIRAKQTYRIPKPGVARVVVVPPVSIPPRRLPP